MVDYYITYSNTDQYYLQAYDRVFNVESEEGKKEFAEVFKSYLKNCSPIKRITELKHFKSSFTAVGLDAKYSYPDIQNLSWEQVKEIDENPLFDIGGHTHNHEIMSYLTEKELSSEIVDCLDILSEKLDREIYLFSYPEGQKHHYNKDVIDKLQENGISICPSAIPGDNDGQLNNFNLKRIMVGFNDTPFPYKEYYDESNS
jgi:peptidoglycan/xylan/chitin deacetylase (PgdA/CDA1 family)